MLHSTNEPGELSQCSKHDDSTINIVVVIIIILLLLSGGNNFNNFAENQLTKFNARDAGDFSDAAGEREMAPNAGVSHEMRETW